MPQSLLYSLFMLTTPDHQKAKADNKYFAAMRAKEAVDMEAKAAQRSVEKQLRLLERAQEVETSLRSQIVCGFIKPRRFTHMCLRLLMRKV